MTVTVHHGDCREVLATLPAESVHACVTDPPYGLTFMGKKWDSIDGAAFQPETWAAVLRVMKPGAHLVAFGGTRTYHRMVCAIEDAGFEVRDQIGYAFGSGFPKSHNVSRALDDQRCSCDDQLRSLRQGSHDAARVAEESQGADLFAAMQRRTTRSGVGQAWTQGGGSENAGVVSERGREDARSEQSSMEGRNDLSEAARELRVSPLCTLPAGICEHGTNGWLRHGAPAGDGALDETFAHADRGGASHRSQPAEQRADEPGIVAVQSQSQDRGAWRFCGRCGKPLVPDGLGTALKPAWEPICLARKPFKGTVAANVLAHGTGGLNIDGCRIGTDDGYAENAVTQGVNTAQTSFAPAVARRTFEPSSLGRWPANLCHDGSDEVLAAFPESESGVGAVKRATGTGYQGNALGKESRPAGTPMICHGDAGSAARFFYTAKADAADRLGSKHPTVKPVDLMRWLVRLVTPPGGLVLDPFAGSGTTGMAAAMESMRAVLIEREAEYVADINRRIAHMAGGDAPLFAEHAPPLQRPGRRIYGRFADERSDR